MMKVDVKYPFGEQTAAVKKQGQEEPDQAVNTGYQNIVQPPRFCRSVSTDSQKLAPSFAVQRCNCGHGMLPVKNCRRRF
jgi:hypothetical protein